MNWVSIDIGAMKSGVAYWDGERLMGSLVIKPCGNKGAYWHGNHKAPSKYTAWMQALNKQEAVVVERGGGNRPNVINGQAKLRGYIEAMCDGMFDLTDFAHDRVPYHEVIATEWKRVIKEDQDISWPRDSARQKALAIKLVRDLYGLEVTEDEADAILLGRAAMRMGIIEL